MYDVLYTPKIEQRDKGRRRLMRSYFVLYVEGDVTLKALQHNISSTRILIKDNLSRWILS